LYLNKSRKLRSRILNIRQKSLQQAIALALMEEEILFLGFQPYRAGNLKKD